MVSSRHIEQEVCVLVTAEGLATTTSRKPSKGKKYTQTHTHKNIPKTLSLAVVTLKNTKKYITQTRQKTTHIHL